VEELHMRLNELDPARAIVAYCRGPFCVFADEAVALLRGRGFAAVRYEEGYPEWAAAGLPATRDEATAGA
jgi:rhodanese-related sulfurtransferase